MGRIVINLFGAERTDDAHVVCDLAEVWEERANGLTGLAELSERMLRRKALELFTLQLCDGLPFGERSRHWLAVHLGKLRFVVERFEMGWAACHAEKDDTLCFGRSVPVSYTHLTLPTIYPV